MDFGDACVTLNRLSIGSILLTNTFSILINQSVCVPLPLFRHLVTHPSKPATVPVLIFFTVICTAFLTIKALCNSLSMFVILPSHYINQKLPILSIEQSLKMLCLSFPNSILLNLLSCFPSFRAVVQTRHHIYPCNTYNHILKSIFKIINK